MSQKTISSGVVHEVPPDLKKALTSDPQALTAWQDITPLARNEWICWIESAKKAETRSRRIEWGCSGLKDGKTTPLLLARMYPPVITYENRRLTRVAESSNRMATAVLKSPWNTSERLSKSTSMPGRGRMKIRFSLIFKRHCRVPWQSSCDTKYLVRTELRRGLVEIRSAVHRGAFANAPPTGKRFKFRVALSTNTISQRERFQPTRSKLRPLTSAGKREVGRQPTSLLVAAWAKVIRTVDGSPHVVMQRPVERHFLGEEHCAQLIGSIYPEQRRRCAVPEELAHSSAALFRRLWLRHAHCEVQTESNRSFARQEAAIRDPRVELVGSHQLHSRRFQESCAIEFPSIQQHSRQSHVVIDSGSKAEPASC